MYIASCLHQPSKAAINLVWKCSHIQLQKSDIGGIPGYDIVDQLSSVLFSLDGLAYTDLQL